MLRVVLGLGFGDEGKGRTVDFLVRKDIADGFAHPLVVRFNGGCQAGHTVVDGSKRHVFSHFGSGTFAGSPTFWSKFCPVSPLALASEGPALAKTCGWEEPWYRTTLQGHPVLMIDPMCPVTTWWDIAANRALERFRRAHAHGSCGVGFGTTIQRQESPYKIYASDFLYPEWLEKKLMGAYHYWAEQLNTMTESVWHESSNRNPRPPLPSELFLQQMDETPEVLNRRFVELVQRMELEKLLTTFAGLFRPSMLFEGAQGILLDQDHGVFPHVTRSYTTVRNVLELGPIRPGALETWYVTRTYATRHGNGPLDNECQLELRNADDETNVSNEFQGSFRTAALSEAAIRYALQVNERLLPSWPPRNLMVTCADQFPAPDFLERLLPNRWQATGPNATDVERQ